MYLSRLTLNPLNRKVQRDLADPIQLHRTILHAFAPLPEKSDFRSKHGVLYRVELSSCGRPSIMVQSSAKPDWSFLQEQAGYLLEVPRSKSIGSLYDAVEEGWILRFRLRANVTKKIDTLTGADGRRRNGKRVALRRPDEQFDWLRRKGEAGGFELIPLSGANPETGPFELRIIPEPDAVGHSRGGAAKNEGAVATAARMLTFGSVTFEGRLRVTDRQRFRQTLANGIGSAKAFGFGLLSVARDCA